MRGQREETFCSWRQKPRPVSTTHQVRTRLGENSAGDRQTAVASLVLPGPGEERRIRSPGRRTIIWGLVWDQCSSPDPTIDRSIPRSCVIGVLGLRGGYLCASRGQWVFVSAPVCLAWIVVPVPKECRGSSKWSGGAGNAADRREPCMSCGLIDVSPAPGRGRPTHAQCNARNGPDEPE